MSFEPIPPPAGDPTSMDVPPGAGDFPKPAFIEPASHTPEPSESGAAFGIGIFFLVILAVIAAALWFFIWGSQSIAKKVRALSQAGQLKPKWLSVFGNAFVVAGAGSLVPGIGPPGWLLAVIWSRFKNKPTLKRQNASLNL